MSRHQAWDWDAVVAAQVEVWGKEWVKAGWEAVAVSDVDAVAEWATDDGSDATGECDGPVRLGRVGPTERSAGRMNRRAQR